MSEAATAVENDFFDLPGVVAYLHSKGLTHVTKRSVTRATYEGRKLLNRTRVGERTYWCRQDVDSWLETLRSQQQRENAE